MLSKITTWRSHGSGHSYAANRYKDPYPTTRIQWKVRPGFFSWFMWCLHRMEEIRICGPPNGLPLRPGSWDGCTLRWEGLLLLLLLVLVPKLPKNDGQELSCLGWYLGWQKPVGFWPMFLWAFCHVPKGPGSSIRKFIYQRFSDTDWKALAQPSKIMFWSPSNHFCGVFFCFGVSPFCFRVFCTGRP